MFFTRSIGRKATVAAVGVTALLGAGGTAFAATSGGGSTPAVAASPAAGSAVAPAHHTRRSRTILARADHASIEVRVKGQWVTYSLDRGKVEAISPTSITLTRPDGQDVTETVNSATKFKGVGSESAVMTGRRAEVLSDNGTALRIRQGVAGGSGAGAGS